MVVLILEQLILFSIISTVHSIVSRDDTVLFYKKVPDEMQSFSSSSSSLSEIKVVTPVELLAVERVMRVNSSYFAIVNLTDKSGGKTKAKCKRCIIEKAETGQEIYFIPISWDDEKEILI